MRADELDFELPQELIAQVPTADRAASRLLHYRRQDRSMAHRRFGDLPWLLRAGDLLVFNDAKVLPARFFLRKASGGRIEGLFLNEIEPGRWRVLLRGLGASRGPMVFEASPEVRVTPLAAGEAGEYEIAVGTGEPAVELLSRVGKMPLPPYIKRDKEGDPRDEVDRQRYQTVYAKEPGSVAAPTAGLHFTPELLSELDAAGVGRTGVTLHVGLGTFKPINAETLEGHRMHVESYSVGPVAAEALNGAKREGRRIVAVGTTAARVLESQPEGEFTPTTGETGIFIYPPYGWKHVGALVTNFHLPRSTLIALVAALIGLDEQRRVYRAAIEQKYRFFSYGDAMLIE